MKEPGVAGLRVGHRFVDQHPQIERPLGAAGQGRGVVEIAGRPQQAADQLVDRGVRHPRAEAVVDREETDELLPKGRVFPAFRIGPGRLVHGDEGALPASRPGNALRIRPHVSQLLRGHISEGRVEDRCEGDVLLRIVEDPQVIEYRHHLERRKIAALRAGIGGNAQFLEDPQEMVRPALHGAQKDHDIPVFHRSYAPVRLRKGPRLHKLKDLRADGPRLRVPQVRGSCALKLLRSLLGEQRHQHRLEALRLRRYEPRDELLRRPVGDAPDLGAHDLAEQRVHIGEHLRPAAEIAGEVDPLSLLRMLRIAAVFSHKEVRTGLAEAVDALAHVPDLEIVGISLRDPADGGEDRLLQIVAVLVLVHHHFPETRRQLLRGVGPLPARHEDVQGLVLEIGEIKEHLPLLPLRVMGPEALREIRKHLQHLSALLLKFRRPRKGQDESRGQILPDRRGFRPVLFEDLPEGRILVLSGLLPGERGQRELRKEHMEGLVVLRRRERAVKCRVRFRRRPVGLRPVRPLRKAEILLRRCQCALCRLPRVPEKELHPGALADLLQRSAGGALPAHRQIPGRIRAAHGGVVDPGDQLADPLFRAAGGEGLHERAEALPAQFPLLCPGEILLLPLLKDPEGLVERRLHGLAAHQLQLALFADLCARFPGGELGIGADHKGAEAVDGGDLRVIEERHLVRQPGIVRIVFHGVRQALHDALFHFPGRGPREGDDQQLVEVHRVRRIEDPPDNALDEHRGLAAAGRRAHQEVVPARPDHALLFFGPVHLPSSFPPSPRASSIFSSASSVFRGRSSR